jgi:phytoene synthase
LRPAFDALFAIDDALADVVARSTQPALGAIKLAWWRERLEDLDDGKVPAEPRLAAAARELLQRGIGVRDIAELEAGWALLLQEQPDRETALEGGAILFRLAARLLGADPAEAILSAGKLYAAGTLARRGLTEPFPLSVERISVPRRFRPLTMLAALGRRDLRRHEAEGTPARAWLLLRHRLTGRL